MNAAAIGVTLAGMVIRNTNAPTHDMELIAFAVALYTLYDEALIQKCRKYFLRFCILEEVRLTRALVPQKAACLLATVGHQRAFLAYQHLTPSWPVWVDSTLVEQAKLTSLTVHSERGYNYQ